MLEFKGKSFVYSATTWTDSIVKSIVRKYCYTEVNILSTSLTNLAVTGTLSEFAWSHVLFASFICSLLLNSQKWFLWYLKLGNFKLMLLLFPVLLCFLSSFSPLASFLPSPPSLPWLLLLRSCKVVDISFCVVSSSINVLNKTKRVYKTCTSWFSATRAPICIKQFVCLPYLLLLV